MGVVEDLEDIAEGEFADLRKAETNAQHTYGLLKPSPLDQKPADEKDLADEKAAKAAAEEEKATAEGTSQRRSSHSPQPRLPLRRHRLPACRWRRTVMPPSRPHLHGDEKSSWTHLRAPWIKPTLCSRSLQDLR